MKDQGKTKMQLINELMEMRGRLSELEKLESQRRKMEEALRESERSLFDSSIDGMLAADMKTRAFKFANPAICKMLGYSEKELKTMTVDDIHPKDTYKTVPPTIEDHIKGEGPTGREVPCIRKDGTIIYADIYVFQYIRNKKKYGLAFFKNTTEQRETKQALEKSERLYRMLAENVRDVICATDLDLRFTYVSPSVTALFGYNVEEFMALTFKDLFTPTAYSISRKAFDDELGREALGKKDLTRSWVLELENIRKDGSLIWAEHKVTFLRDTDKRLVGSLSVIRDVTEKKLTREALINSEKELKTKAGDLEEVNTALRVLLKKRDEDKTELEEKVLFNMKELALPYLEKLKKNGLSPKQETYAEILESNLNEIISPFARGLSTKYLSLTSAEIQVANLIKQGKSTKDIAELLNLSYRTIEVHRKKIRSKMGIRNEKVNLRTHLLFYQ